MIDNHQATKPDKTGLLLEEYATKLIKATFHFPKHLTSQPRRHRGAEVVELIELEEVAEVVVGVKVRVLELKPPTSSLLSGQRVGIFDVQNFLTFFEKFGKDAGVLETEAVTLDKMEG